VRAVVALIAGGHHSTSRAIGFLLEWAFGDSALRDALLAQPNRIPDAAEEALRLHTPLPSFSRRAAADHEIDGTSVASGEQTLLHYDRANRDPEVFSHPESFDIDRQTVEHLAFGWGAHRCVGMHLARAEIRIALQELLRPAPEGHLVEPVEWVGPAEPAFVLVARVHRRSA
jgi:cytochrome P450